MRKLALQVFSALVLASTAQAATDASCRTEAAAAADAWAALNFDSENDAESAESQPLLVISAGRKYIVSRRGVNAETKRPHELGSVLVQRNQVYHEELDRCLGNLTMKVVGTKPLILKREASKHAGQN